MVLYCDLKMTTQCGLCRTRTWSFLCWRCVTRLSVYCARPSSPTSSLGMLSKRRLRILSTSGRTSRLSVTVVSASAKPRSSFIDKRQKSSSAALYVHLCFSTVTCTLFLRPFVLVSNGMLVPGEYQTVIGRNPVQRGFSLCSRTSRSLTQVAVAQDALTTHRCASCMVVDWSDAASYLCTSTCCTTCDTCTHPACSTSAKQAPHNNLW